MLVLKSKGHTAAKTPQHEMAYIIPSQIIEIVYFSVTLSYFSYVSQSFCCCGAFFTSWQNGESISERIFDFLCEAMPTRRNSPLTRPVGSRRRWWKCLYLPLGLVNCMA